MKVVSMPGARVETLIHRVLTAAMGRGKTEAAMSKTRRSAWVPCGPPLCQKFGGSACDGRRASVSPGAAAARAQRHGAKAPAATGAFDAT